MSGQGCDAKRQGEIPSVMDRLGQEIEVAERNSTNLQERLGVILSIEPGSQLKGEAVPETGYSCSMAKDMHSYYMRILRINATLQDIISGIEL